MSVEELLVVLGFANLAATALLAVLVVHKFADTENLISAVATFIGEMWDDLKGVVK